MKFKKALFFIPGLVFIIMRWLLPDNHPLENIFSIVGIVLMLLGEFIYRKVRSKEEEALDTNLEKEGRVNLAKAYDVVTNIVPSTEKAVGKKLDELINKSKESTQTSAEKIKELSILKDEGVITEDEFKDAKKKILGV
jgi:hypothetical protein